VILKDQAHASNLRCGAKTRQGTPCKNPPCVGKNRCRMHGGAKGSGAPIGNQNARKHGFYTRESILARRRVAFMVKHIKELRDFAEVLDGCDEEITMDQKRYIKALQAGFKYQSMCPSESEPIPDRRVCLS